MIIFFKQRNWKICVGCLNQVIFENNFFLVGLVKLENVKALIFLSFQFFLEGRSSLLYQILELLNILKFPNKIRNTFCVHNCTFFFLPLYCRLLIHFNIVSTHILSFFGQLALFTDQLCRFLYRTTYISIPYATERNLNRDYWWTAVFN